jgi:competence protein ComEC
LTLLPVTATLFSRVGAAGLVLNFVAIPMMAVLQVAGALGIALVDRFPHVAAVPAAAARWSGWLLLGSARLVDVLPWLSWRVPPPPWWALAAFYAAGVWWFVRARGRTRAVAAGVFAAAAVLVAFAPETALARPGKDVLRFTVVDVGQGDALLVQLPSGRDLAIDGGTRVAGFDAGDRLVTPALWASGVRRLDWAAFTHADLDHIGGVDSLVSTFSPREIWEGVPVEPDPKRRALVRHAGDAGIVWRGVRKGDAVRDGAVTVDVLNPPEPDWQRRRVRNDDSVVMRVRYGDVELLLTGDISEEAERAIDASADRAAIRILKVAHHGSRTSSSPDFVTRYAPDVAVVSVGRSNLFGHPSPEVVQRLARAGAVVFRTDRDGAIILETDGRSVHVRSMAGRVWTVGVRRARS